MTIYQVTYRSDQYRVKGFLALPEAVDFPPEQLDLLCQVSQREQHWSFDGVVLEDAVNGAEIPIRELDRVVAPPPASCCDVSEALDTGFPQGPQHIQRFPALIYCRGGIGRVGMVRMPWMRLFASYGFVVFAPAYRGNLGGEGRDEFGGADAEDVHAAVRLVQSLPFVQRDRVSVLGFSRGSINATLSAIAVPGVHRLISWGGVSDLTKTYEERVDLRRMLKRVIGGSPNKVPHEYERRSPVHLASNIPCPVLIVHGTADVQVDFSHGKRLYETLVNLNHPVDFHAYEGYGHHLPSAVHEAVVERMLDWVSR
jgi:dipeptidyl aminopeptidase/acylaminoacyl peptidase